MSQLRQGRCCGLLSSLLTLASVACSSHNGSNADSGDGGDAQSTTPADAAFFADSTSESGGADAADAAVVVVDPCGDTAGLEPGALWPVGSRCPTHIGSTSVKGPDHFHQRWMAPIGSFDSEGSPAIGA